MKCAHLFLLVFVVFVFYKLYRFKIDFAVDKVANNVTQVWNNNLHVATICRCSLLLNKNIAWHFVGKLEQVSSYETPLYQNVRNIKWKRKKKFQPFAHLVRKFVAFLTGAEGWRNVNQAAKNTLCALNPIPWSAAAKQGTISRFKQEIVILLTCLVLRNKSTKVIHTPLPIHNKQLHIGSPGLETQGVNKCKTVMSLPKYGYYLRIHLNTGKKRSDRIWEILLYIALHYEAAAELAARLLPCWQLS